MSRERTEMLALTETRILTVCPHCGAVAAPDGKCLAVGDCAAADATATRGLAGNTAKFAVPAAWNVRGGVD